MIRITPELLERYDKPGPRYTSYPTAVEFSESFGPTDYAGRLGAAAAFRREYGMPLPPVYAREMAELETSVRAAIEEADRAFERGRRRPEETIPFYLCTGRHHN